MQPNAFVFLEIFSREGGIQSYVRDIFQAYSQQVETPADVFLLRDGKASINPYSGGNLTFHYLKASHPTLGRAKLAAALFAYLVKNQPQHLYCGHINLAPLVRQLCAPLKIPYTILTYGKEVWEPLDGPKRQALQQADRIWTISRYSRDQMCAANGIAPEKVDFLYCAVDGQAFTPRDPNPKWIEQYGLADSQVIMTVARLWSGDPYKGVDVTIRALPQIARLFPRVKYLVVGRGDDQPRLAQLALDLGVGDRVIFAGFVANEDLCCHYNLADIYVMPSQEGFGIVYLEAMACGKPVLSGDADGSADPLQDGKLGWQVPHRDPIAVEYACIEMLKGDQMRTQGTWLREQALLLFDKPAFGIRLKDLMVNKT
jgi:phosphatidyl-myo-inositol dimannoside synthase